MAGLVPDGDEHLDGFADKLGGRLWSHGTVMRRLWERGCRLIQVGIRSLSRSEYELVRSGPRIETFFAHELAARWDELMQLLARLEGSRRRTGMVLATQGAPITRLAEAGLDQARPVDNALETRLSAVEPLVERQPDLR